MNKYNVPFGLDILKIQLRRQSFPRHHFVINIISQIHYTPPTPTLYRNNKLKTWQHFRHVFNKQSERAEIVTGKKKSKNNSLGNH